MSKEKNHIIIDNIQLFPGFYNSELCCNIELLNNNLYMLPKNNIDYNNIIGKVYIDNILMYANLDDSIVSDIEFDSIDSPMEYNYRTDRLCYNCMVDTEKLKKWCNSHDEFSQYIYNYRSKNGYISNVVSGRPSVDNVLDNFNYNIDIMLDFYLIKNCNVNYAIGDTISYIYENVHNIFDCYYHNHKLNKIIYDIEDLNELEYRDIPYLQESKNDVENIQKYYYGSNKKELLKHLKEVVDLAKKDVELNEFEFVFDDKIYNLEKFVIK